MGIPEIELIDGNSIPSIGLGLWKVKDKQQFRVMFEAAYQAGYRHFDDAEAYANEQLLGLGWKNLGLKRESLFITTKSLALHFNYKSTIDSFEESLKKLQTDHVDLLLVHFPGPTWLRRDKWRAIEDIKKAGKARSIGVSNYYVKHLNQLESYANEMPVVNQIEMHVFRQQLEIRQYCQKNNIQIEAYSPIAHAQIMDNPVIKQLADKYQKTYSQIMLRWCIDQQAIPLPKSVTPSRIQENIDIFDFKLDDKDLERLKALDINHKSLWRSSLSG
jgi:diketogulonate reductase-like aldo/keto reductase